MQFGDDSSDEFSLMALTLPSDHMLIAEIRDETVSVAGTTRLTFFLSVTSDED